MKLSICIDSIFEGKAPERAIAESAAYGIHAIEFWGWWDKDVKAIKKACDENKVELAALCTPFISLTDPSQREKYINGLRETIETAKYLGCKTIISQTGSDTGKARDEQRTSLTEGLKMCAPLLAAADMTLTVEPLNLRVDHAGYFLSSSDECAEIIEDVGRGSVKMLFDVYHQQITEGDIVRRITQYSGIIGHFHTAGNPGRHELYNSELDYRRVFRAIEETGYDRYVGLEYFPADEVKKGTDFALSIKP